jgi:flagellar biogenesis protein FliO
VFLYGAVGLVSALAWLVGRVRSRVARTPAVA